jgi:hypothetical protein
VAGRDSYSTWEGRPAQYTRSSFNSSSSNSPSTLSLGSPRAPNILTLRDTAKCEVRGSLVSRVAISIDHMSLSVL